jgi:hypothetical protein
MGEGYIMGWYFGVDCLLGVFRFFEWEMFIGLSRLG